MKYPVQHIEGEPQLSSHDARMLIQQVHLLCNAVHELQGEMEKLKVKPNNVKPKTNVPV